MPSGDRAYANAFWRHSVEMDVAEASLWMPDSWSAGRYERYVRSADAALERARERYLEKHTLAEFEELRARLEREARPRQEPI